MMGALAASVSLVLSACGQVAGDAEKAVTAAKQLIGEGVNIIVGGVSSEVALALAEQAAQNQVLFISGPAAADGVTGINERTSAAVASVSRRSQAPAPSLTTVRGRKVLMFAQDTAFGQENAAGEHRIADRLKNI